VALRDSRPGSQRKEPQLVSTTAEAMKGNEAFGLYNRALPTTSAWPSNMTNLIALLRTLAG
jgi:hypothetical protein